MGPAVILDKSALEALSVDESVWLEAFLDANVVPPFYVEVLADLEKQGRQGQAPEAVVARLAEKTPSDAYPNVHHRQIVMAEFAGEHIAMDRRPVIAGGEAKMAPDGTIGIHVDAFPEQAALLRWQRHDFAAVERLAAKRWRKELAVQDLSQMVERVRTILPANRTISDLMQLKAFIDEFCASSDRKVLALALAVLGVSDRDARVIRKRWEKELKRPLGGFAPYAAHVFKVDLLFYLGVARGFISGERASNRADMAYLYYLPFAAAFVSGDRLHRRTVPLFLDDKQSFLDANEIKSALRELDRHHEKLPEDIKALGVLGFASYPPSALDNAVTRLWDQTMRPDWRDRAAECEARVDVPRNPDADRRTVDELTARIEGARGLPADVASRLSAEIPDYLFRTRRVPATKGKWRIVPTELEADDREG